MCVDCRVSNVCTVSALDAVSGSIARQEHAQCISLEMHTTHTHTHDTNNAKFRIFNPHSVLFAYTQCSMKIQRGRIYRTHSRIALCRRLRSLHLLCY